MTFNNTYADYWNFVTHLARHAHDITDLKEACINQKILSEEIILRNTTQHPTYTADIALFQDALKLYEEAHNASHSIT